MRVSTKFGLWVLAWLVLLLPSCSGDNSTSPSTSSFSVTITAPAANAIVGGVVDIVASSNGAEKVDFYIDDTQIGFDPDSPFVLSWDSTTLPNGNHEIRVVATQSGRTETSSVPVLVNNLGGGISVVVNPKSATLAGDQQQQFTATVLGDANTAVTWSIDGGAPGTLTQTGLYTAPNSFTPQTVQIRATSQADPNQVGLANIVLQKGPPEVAVSVTPSSVELLLEATQSFSATVSGTKNAGVTWSVVEGAGAGTIDTNGLYTAPSALPSPPTATIRATSLADGTKFDEATVTLSDGSGLPPSEVDLLRATYTAGFDTQRSITDTNDLMMRAIFFASCQNNNEPTVSGSVVETGPNSGVFTWDPEPTDRLRIVFGSGQTFEMTFTAIDGDVGDLDCDDHLGFSNAHAADYMVTGEGVSIRIQSLVTPLSDGFTTTVEQAVDGTLTLEGTTWAVAGEVSGQKTFFVDTSSGFSQTRHNLQISAVFTAGARRIETTQQQAFSVDSGSSITVSDQSDSIGATGTDGTVTFTLQNVVYEWTDSNERDPIYQASGRLLRNGVDIGGIAADSSTGQSGVILNDGTVIEF